MNLFSRLMQADPDAVAGSPSGEASTPSLDHTIGALFDKMEAEGSANDPEAHETRPGEHGQASDATVVQKPASRTRAADGTFSAKATGEELDPAEAAKDTGPAVETKPETPAAPASQFAEAPKSWNAAERAAWANAPEAVRAAAHRREEDFHRGIEQYRGKASTFDALDAVIRPHAEIFTKRGQTAIENVGALLNLQQVLYTGDETEKFDAILHIVEQSGIKPEALLEGLQNPRQRPAQDPRYDTLVKRQEALEARIREAQTAPVLNEVEAFLADPKNEHLSEPGMTDSMLGLINSGVAKTVREAYDKACRLSDSVQAKVAATKAEADRKAQAERDAAEAKRKADLAAKATRASSINVKPRGATAGPATKGTMDHTIGAAYDRMHGSGN